MADLASTSIHNGTSQPARYSLAQYIIGAGALHRITTSKVLVVGAGGIGCELLKNLVLTGFGNIEIIDLDTIDLSNLNRQFLFQKQHIKKPKSIVAKQTAHSFNPLVNITAYHANIKEPRFGVAYFQTFDLVMNALDNLDARRWVNKMCIAADVPLIESGTTGFLGQVQPIKKGVTECYDCVPKPTPKTFPVCTIRSTPSTPIHCIVWAKNWLFTQLFGADDETEDAELDKAITDGEDAKEIDSLRKEQTEMRDMRATLLEAANKGDQDEVRVVVERVFNKVYKNDIDRLLGMEEMWTHRPVKPVPLVFQDAINNIAPEGSNVNAPTTTHDSCTNAKSTRAASSAIKLTETNASKLKDQQTLSLSQNVSLFLKSTTALAIRAALHPNVPLSFDKDDSDALDFVTSSSNLRSMVYHIDRKTRFEVKQMAGNIIPAIASTNAIIAGMLVLQAMHALSGEWSKTRFVSLQRGSSRMLTSWIPGPPKPDCGTCQDVYIPIQIQSLESVTLEEVIEEVVKRGMGMEEEELVVYNGNRVLADPDFDDNLGKSLKDVGLTEGSMLTVTDEDQVLQVVNIVISTSVELKEKGEKIRTLAKELSKPKPRVKNNQGTKDEDEDDSDDDDDVVIVEAADVPVVVKTAITTNVAVGKKRSHSESDETTTTVDNLASTPDKKRKTQSTFNNKTNKDGSNADTAIEFD
ncbi:related to ubiquitin-like protein activating enzyme [Melanopsichium pennsylvanicum]|uniref:Ubiquitin-activating enzyme E1-like n=2 Tax=Melanopsichium pennsylvanicum TaxID=63383 RepID=A0AAJ5C399_9BASI|nr:related to ubiquitin-like protein activating enzyme [Melanopsichium pennsylvanicum 4]SNX82381.1 related to ubiquitin-like protein activating enzyme [Melanopsichium pennsylvanicum]